MGRANHGRFAVIEGGASGGSAPQDLFGAGPIVSSRVPPLAISAWLNQGLVHGLPLSVADWM